MSNQEILPITDRSFLINLRETAVGMATGNLNPQWVRAYLALADAADWLDAMEARCTNAVVENPSHIPPKENGNAAESESR